MNTAAFPWGHDISSSNSKVCQLKENHEKYSVEMFSFDIKHYVENEYDNKRRYRNHPEPELQPTGCVPVELGLQPHAVDLAGRLGLAVQQQLHHLVSADL